MTAAPAARSGRAARLGIALALAWRAQPRALLGYAAGSLVGGVVPVAAAWLSKLALDRVAAGGGAEAAWTFGVALAVVGLGVSALPPLLRYLQGELGRAVAIRAKEELYRRVTGIPLLSTLEVPEFRDRLRLAEQGSRSGPGEVVAAAIGLARSAVTLSGLLVAVSLIDPWLAAALLLSALPALAAELRLSRWRTEMLWRISPAERREMFYTDLLTSLAAAKETRLYGTGALFRRRMLAELATTSAEQRRFERRESAVQVGLAGLAAVLAGVALVRVLLATARGEAGPGDVAAVVVAVGGMQAAISGAVMAAANGHQAGLLLEHFRVLTAPPAPDPRPVPRPPVPGTGIELDDVWFRYGPGLPWVLRGITLTVRPGESLALVGENGSGKSTLVKLLCRLYDPTRGAIRWDGVDLRDLPLEEVRGRIGAVFQDFMSYELTAAENIALGDVDGRDELDLGPERIEAAARRAEVHATLDRLPAGYRTLLSRVYVDTTGDEDAGVLLSGGQWQRLALARALLRGQRDLIVLDEPSSGLDAEAEHRVHQRIAEHRRGRTSVLVSHRLNTVRDADRIVVLAAGEVVEQGGHDALLAANGTYARLFRLQAAGYQPAPTVEPAPAP